jgi:hypothetical protein
MTDFRSQPPADGEVAELVADMRHFLVGYGQMRGLDPENIYSIHRGHAMEAHITVSKLTRAAALLERMAAGPAVQSREPASVVEQPIPVSERLPEAGDCDAEGRCWWWHPSHPESGYQEGWMLRPGNWGTGHYDADDCLAHTHWLPAHALPLPGGKVE